MPVSQREYVTLDKPAQSDKAEGFPRKGWILDTLSVQVQRCTAHSPLGKDHSPAARSRMNLEPPAISCKPKSLSSQVIPAPASYFCSAWDSYNGPVLPSHPLGWNITTGGPSCSTLMPPFSPLQVFLSKKPLHSQLHFSVCFPEKLRLGVELSRKEGSRVDLWMGPLTVGGNEKNPIPCPGPSCGHFPQGWLEGRGWERGWWRGLHCLIWWREEIMEPSSLKLLTLRH